MLPPKATLWHPCPALQCQQLPFWSQAAVLQPETLQSGPGAALSLPLRRKKEALLPLSLGQPLSWAPARGVEHLCFPLGTHPAKLHQHSTNRCHTSTTAAAALLLHGGDSGLLQSSATFLGGLQSDAPWEGREGAEVLCSLLVLLQTEVSGKTGTWNRTTEAFRLAKALRITKPN